MLAPKTYTGYDQDGNQVCSCTATDACEYINPDEVQAAIDNVERVAEEQIQNIISALQGVAPDASDAVIVEGTKMDGVIEDVCTSLGTVSKSIGDSISSMYTEALSAHDQLQQNSNDQAYNSVISYNGVVRVV